MILAAKIIAAIVLLEVAVALPAPDSPPQYGPPKHEEYKEPPKPYQFDYGVRDDYSGVNFGHQEASDGNAISGSYQVQLADGRIQTVKYIADHENGFQAQVEYQGEAQYPEAPVQEAYSSQQKPVYKSEPVYNNEPVYQSEPAQQLYEGENLYTEN